MRSKNYRSRNHVIQMEEFQDIRDFVRWSDERPENNWSECHTPTTTDREWLLHGWDKMKDKIESQLTKLSPVITQERKIQEKVYSYNGYYPNVSRAVRGNPRCMGRYKKNFKDTKIVEIIWDPGISANENASKIEAQGVKLLARIKSLELAGYRVKLVVQGFKGRQEVNEIYMCRITIKEENQQLDLSRISYPLASAEMLRTWVFHWYEHLPDARYLSGYGVSLYRWTDYERQEILDAVNVRSNQYYVNLGTNIEQMFKPLLKGE